MYVCLLAVSSSKRYDQKMAAVNGSGRYLSLNEYCSLDPCCLTITFRKQHNIFYFAVFVEFFNFTVCIFSAHMVLKFPSRAVLYKSGYMDYLCGNCEYKWEFIELSDSNFSRPSTGVNIICSFLHITLQNTQRWCQECLMALHTDLNRLSYNFITCNTFC